MLKYVLTIFVSASLAACGQTQAGDLFRQQAVERLAAGADAFGENAEIAICDGVTAGFLRRHYAPNAEKMTGWNQFCSIDTTPDIVVTPRGPDE